MTDQEKQQLVNQYYNEYSALGTGTEKPTYQGIYDDQIKSLYDQISNREDFSYDLKGDALYQQYKDNYMQQGKQAMKDTMGQAASLTGGYGSSYSQAAGQQAYDASLQNLANIIPDLWNMAYQVYQDKGTQLQNQYAMLNDLANTEYNRYQNDLSDWKYNNETAYNRYQDAYNRAANEENTAYNRQQEEANTAWTRQDTNYSNLYKLIGATGYSPSDEELAAAGMSRAQANALIAAFQAAQQATSGSGSKSGGSSSSSTTRSNGANGNAYSVNGYTGDKIYNTLEDEAAQAWLEDDLSQYVKVKNKGYTLSTDKKGKTTYSSPSSSKAATDAINKVLASIK